MLLSLGYAVTVDMHPGSDLGALIARDPAHAQRALADGWRQLAKQLLRWPSEFVFAELLNEPPMPDALWRSMARALIEEARGVAASHYLIVGPAPYQRPDALLAWEPFADSRIVYACHYYSPMVFTHQGADWEKGSPWAKAAGVPFPTHRDDTELINLARQARSSGNDALAQELGQMAQQNCNAESIDAEFEALAAWSARTGAPVIINEFGVLKRNVKREHRLAWLSANSPRGRVPTALDGRIGTMRRTLVFSIVRARSTRALFVRFCRPSDEVFTTAMRVFLAASPFHQRNR